jgi:DNA polymerase-1
MPPVTWVDDEDTMMQLVERIRETGECAVDTETTGLDRWRDRVLFWSMCPDEDSRYCLSARMIPIYNRELANDPDIVWYFTNQTFDFCMMNNSGAIPPIGETYDTLAMDWLRDENRQGRHGLKETAWDYLGLHMNTFNKTFPKEKRDDTIKERILRVMERDPERGRGYASEDAWATFRVFHKIKADLQEMYTQYDQTYWEYFREVEAPFTRVLYDCCRRGIMVDIGYLRELGPTIQTELDEIQKQINKIAGKEINIRSPLQLRALLFDKMKLKPIKMTDGGTSGNKQPSTDVTSLKIWAEQGVGIAKFILRHRDLSKTLGTYVNGLQKWIDDDLRIHPTMTQHVTVTGRLSSKDPNLQNIPRPSSDKFSLRSAFIPKQDHVFVVADYEQLEMRLMAHFSQDKNMIDVINRGWDIHTGTASLMFNHKYEDILEAIAKKKAHAKDPSVVLTALEKDMCFHRQASKTIGFGLNYGMGPAHLAEVLELAEEFAHLDVPGLKAECTRRGIRTSKSKAVMVKSLAVDMAKDLTEQYFGPYPQVREYIEDNKATGRLDGQVETIIGRPRRLPDLQELGNLPFFQLSGIERKLVARADRQAGNSIIQGSAADVAKMAMIKVNNDPLLNELGCELLLQIHDELVVEVPEEHLDEAMPRIIELMEHPLDYDLAVPLDVDGGAGWSWAEAKA